MNEIHIRLRHWLPAGLSLLPVLDPLYLPASPARPPFNWPNMACLQAGSQTCLIDSQKSKRLPYRSTETVSVLSPTNCNTIHSTISQSLKQQELDTDGFYDPITAAPGSSNHTALENIQEHLQDTDPTSSNVGSPLSEQGGSDPSTSLENTGEHLHYPNPSDHVVQIFDNSENPQPSDFWLKLNKHVITWSTGSAVLQAALDRDGNLIALRVIAAANAFAFMCSFLAFILSDKKPRSVRPLASAGGAGLILMMNVALGEYICPAYPISFGILGSFPPAFALLKRALSKE